LGRHSCISWFAGARDPTPAACRALSPRGDEGYGLSLVPWSRAPVDAFTTGLVCGKRSVLGEPAMTSQGRRPAMPKSAMLSAKVAPVALSAIAQRREHRARIPPGGMWCRSLVSRFPDFPDGGSRNPV